MFWLLTALKYVNGRFTFRENLECSLCHSKVVFELIRQISGNVQYTQNNTTCTLKTAHAISLISPSKSSCSSSTSNSDSTSSISMSTKFVLRVERNETVWTCHVPFDTKKFSNLSLEILVEWKAPKVILTIFLWFNRLFGCFISLSIVDSFHVLI